MKKTFDTKKLVMLSLFCAIAYLSVFILRIPMVSFLKYEPKDVIITLCALICGTIPTIMVSIVVSFIEMVTISDNGPIGLLMNVLATLSFSLPVAILYKKKKSLNRAVIGLLIGTIAMTTIMILWNYLITPIYLGVPRDVVVDMLVPVFLPFNILKGIINSTFVFLLYKPLISALRQSKLIVKSNEDLSDGKNQAIIFNTISVAILIICIALWIVWKINQ